MLVKKTCREKVPYIVHKTGHVCSARELWIYSKLKARKHEYRNADDYIQDPETGLMQGRRPSSSNGSSGSAAGLTEGNKNDKINGELKAVIESPEKLGDNTPKQWKKILSDEGREVTPLSSGRLKGISFENGGGYKTNFEDGGIFMYHPAYRSHHGGEYYKISTGKGGTNRYDRNGKRITRPKSRT
jgi:hypothetical protein